ncbi:MAG: dehydrogenase, partial [Bacteroidetes bacterium]
QQQHNVQNQHTEAIAAMHAVKKQAYDMKAALLKGRLDLVGELFDTGFTHKRMMAGGISTPEIETIYAAAKISGAMGGKISGAGGGGFMFFYCPGQSLHAVRQTLNSFTGQVINFGFAETGLVSWTI